MTGYTAFSYASGTIINAIAAGRGSAFAIDLKAEAEIELIHQVFEQFGTMDKWTLVDLSHTFPEWKDPKGSAIPISYSDILKAEHKSEEEIKIIENELESIIAMDRYL